MSVKVGRVQLECSKNAAHESGLMPINIQFSMQNPCSKDMVVPVRNARIGCAKARNKPIVIETIAKNCAQ